MALNINSLFNNATRPVGDVSQVSSVTPQSTGEGDGAKVLSGLSAGSSVTGQVVSSEDGNITIRLADNSTVSAELRGAIALEAGDQVTFTIASNRNNNIILSPLFTNLNASPNIENALNQASLPVNGQTTAMVDALMRQGMGIDKNSLVDMYKLVSDNPTIAPESVVKLTQMGLAVNELNAETLSQYESMNHQLSGAAEKIAGDIAETFNSLAESSPALGKDLLAGIADLFKAEGDAANVKGEEGAVNENGQQSVNAAGENPEAVKEAAVNESDPSKVSADARAVTDGLVDGKETVTVSSEGAAATKGAEAALNQEALSARTLLGDDMLKDLMKALKSAGADDETLRMLTRPETDASKALQTINDILQNSGSETAAKNILSNPALSQLVKETLSQDFLLKPETFADKESVEQFYEKLRAQGGKLQAVAEQILGKDAPLTQSSGALNQNLDFMNQLNQAFTYVQIPLKLENQNANGDLYVYANKKNLADKDGNLSAFLHLDMDHLGSVDVYVTMQSEKVSTNFKVEDDAVLDLIEAHIDELNERLEKKGYKMNMTVAVKGEDEETSAFEEMKKDAGVMPIAISHVAFDARA